MTRDPVAEAAARIDQLLPQTQCTRCGYPGCLPYATAMARGEANINRCPPGGQATIQALADLLAREPLPLDPAHGHEAPPRLAWIDEERCIGCARCLPPCPVDAIIGAAKSLHTVLPDRCVGCELCIPACPVDCIEMRDAEVPAAKTAAVNRLRYQGHLARHARRLSERQQAIDAKKAAALNAVRGPPADRT